MSKFAKCDICGRECFCHQGVDENRLESVCVGCYGWLRRLVFYRVGIKITIDLRPTPTHGLRGALGGKI